MEFSLYNSFKVIKNISVNNVDKKIIQVNLARNPSVIIPHWSYEVEKLVNSEDESMIEWGQKMKTFSEKFEDMIRGYDSRNSAMVDSQIQFFTEMNTISAKKRQQLFETYPCLHFKLRKTENNFEFNDLFFNEEFCKEIGYTADSFISTILEEGLPQVSHLDNEANLVPLQFFIDTSFGISKEGFESKPTESTILTKSGYAKKVQVQYYVMLNYENSVFDVDFITTYVSHDEPKLNKSLLQKNEMNQAFLKKMTTKEKELSKFLSIYYDESLPLRYTHHNKVCGIRELITEEQNQ